jgi:outer membrane receptor protein involved in Fe transport
MNISLKIRFTPFLVLFSSLISAQPIFAEDILDEIIVTANFRTISAQNTAASLSIVSEEALSERSAKHLEDVLTIAPNVNSAAGASRGRFFQIRGIGERSQFKEPLDSSVGLIVDGVDFSNLGLAGNVYDVQQVEILRGSQGTTFGSSALAGLINIRSGVPTEAFEGQVDLGAGNYGSHSLGMIVSGPISETLLGRVAVNKVTGDGYIKNDFSNRDDTNNIDELLIRTKLNWSPIDTLDIGLTAVYIDADNGYNAFSLENTRHTRSDEPGHDRQESIAIALQSTWDGSAAYVLETQITVEDSKLEYGFDWDWSDFNTAGVRGFENNARDREAKSADIRLLSKPGNEIFNGASWVGGVYIYDRKVDLSYIEDANYPDSWGAWTGSLSSSYTTARFAAYGQLDWSISDRWWLSLGSRVEHFDNQYTDSYGVVGEIEDDLIGGKLSLTYSIDDSSMAYVSLTRGYKTGGINSDAMGKALVNDEAENIAFLQEHLSYEGEVALNYEVGFKNRYLDDSLLMNVSAFYIDRSDMQANVAFEISTSNWTAYRENIQDSNNYGVEFELAWQANEQLRLFSALGLLETELGDLEVLDVNDEVLDQSGRQQAHAPGYQFNVGLEFDFMQNYSVSIQVDGKDSFYFSNSHNEQSDSYELLHANLKYNRGPFTLSLWGRNLTDEDYQVRGFYFANNPTNGWIPESYNQLGEPRVFGLSGKYDF